MSLVPTIKMRSLGARKRRSWWRLFLKRDKVIPPRTSSQNPGRNRPRPILSLMRLTSGASTVGERLEKNRRIYHTDHHDLTSYIIIILCLLGGTVYLSCEHYYQSQKSYCTLGTMYVPPSSQSMINHSWQKSWGSTCITAVVCRGDATRDHV